MIAWLKGAWAKTGLWVKLAGIAILATLSYIGYLRLKSRGAEREAEVLRAELAVKTAEAQVAYLEGQKVRNAERLARIPAEAAALDASLRAERLRLVEAQGKIEGMTPEQVAARFRELGY